MPASKCALVAVLAERDTGVGLPLLDVVRIAWASRITYGARQGLDAGKVSPLCFGVAAVHAAGA